MEDLFQLLFRKCEKYFTLSTLDAVPEAIDDFVERACPEFILSPRDRYSDMITFKIG
jgi:hypothetical protein